MLTSSLQLDSLSPRRKSTGYVTVNRLTTDRIVMELIDGRIYRQRDYRQFVLITSVELMWWYSRAIGLL